MEAVVGKPDKSGAMSEPVAPSVAVAVLLAVLPSLVAPVVPVSVAEPGVVGVPLTVHVILAPGATLVGGAGTHEAVRPAGKPVTPHVAAVAATAGAAAFEHVKVPVYGTPTLIAVGRVLRSMLMSAPVTATALVAVLLPELVSLVAPVATETVEEPGPVGMPATVHEMLAPAATVAGGVGVHVPTVTPGGRPVIAHVALAALAVAVALLVHLIVPL
jgi:hypothetical protein